MLADHGAGDGRGDWLKRPTNIGGRLGPNIEQVDVTRATVEIDQNAGFGPRVRGGERREWLFRWFRGQQRRQRQAAQAHGTDLDETATREAADCVHATRSLETVDIAKNVKV